MEGILATGGNVDSLALHLLHILTPPANDTAMYRHLGARLCRRAIQQFGWVAAGRHIGAVYCCLSGDAPGSALMRQKESVALKNLMHSIRR